MEEVQVPSSDEDVSCADLFKEPEGHSPEEKGPTFASYTLSTGEVLSVRLVGHNPLWGHVLWNAARVAAGFLENNASDLVSGKDVLELGAGAGVPSLVCALRGARKVVITDYPDPDLIDNIKYNVDNCEAVAKRACEIHASGYLWGRPLMLDSEPAGPFDLLILADLVFNHSEHEKLVHTMKMTLKKVPEAKALVFFTPHRPWLLERDMMFFKLAERAGFRVTKLSETLMQRPMYKEDPGDELLRRTVYSYEIAWHLAHDSRPPSAVHTQSSTWPATEI